ncbi:AraC family transcriptional regulator [Sphingomonas crusticola]|uniref:AraC family transcriptional regulator n=1 Tax=Sphingomonas crusticola TaxID=1697973 RepID=UPI000E21CFC6|nr:AraC family transcriptional regulator [Sphingomonas crusticola]
MDQMAELSAIITRHAPATGMYATPVRCLSLFRADQPTLPIPSVYEASLCLITQGAKRVSIGDTSLLYDAAHYLVVSVDLPLTGHIVEASADEPYLCCKIDLDLRALADLIIAEGRTGRRDGATVLAVYPSDPDLVDAACRLVRLIEQPASIATLAPLIEREILYRLLMGPHGSTLRQIAAADSHLNQVSRAIAAIRGNFRDQLRIREIAAAAGMSDSSLHAHFKAVTRMTPLEYQKQLRLQEARRLMLTEGASAGTAGFAVGYDSPSQFSREYRRLFGAPPRQDVERLQVGRDYLSATLAAG